MPHSYGIKQTYGIECQRLNAEESKQSQILEGLRTRGIGKYLFQSPLDEKGKEGMAELLRKSEGLSPAALSANDYIVRMWSYWQIGEKEKSLSSANRALNLNPDNLVGLNCRVYLLADLERYVEARATLEHFVRVSNKNEGLHAPVRLAFVAT